MALKAVVARRVLDEILGKLHKEGSWKVLVLDKLATRIISACCKMSDVMSKGITLVEDLAKARQPLPHLEAIYIVVPNEDNVKAIINDFAQPSKNMYKAAHIFFVEKCSTSLFSRIGASKASRKIATLKEANMAFLPYESKVFTLDYPEAFADFYSASSNSHANMAERIADQVATVCAMLGEYPVVRHRADIGILEDIASAIQAKLDSYKADKAELGTGPDKSRSQLIILDRGFDVVSPILHELTYQAMVYDLLTIDNDVYKYRATTMGGEQKAREVILDENDPIWFELRHEHIADVSRDVAQRMNEFAVKKHLKPQGDKAEISIKDLARYIKRVPQHQKELSEHALHINLVDELLKRYRQGGEAALAKVAKVEQNLAMGTDAQGEAITDPMADMTPLMFSDLPNWNKIRLIILYILYSKGVSRANFSKLVQHSSIPHSDRKIITNLMHLGYKIIQEESVSVPKHRIKLKERLGEKYEVSRWTPLLQDIAEYAAEGRLDENYAPSLRGSVPRPTSGSSYGSAVSGGSAGASGTAATGASVRQRWNWIPGTTQAQEGKDKSKAAATVAKKSGPTIILFIVGGMTYSEMRAVYEASKATNCEVIIGSTHISTPTIFMEQLRDLKPLVTT